MAGWDIEMCVVQTHTVKTRQLSYVYTMSSPKKCICLLVSFCRLSLFPHFLLQCADFPGERVDQLQGDTQNNTFILRKNKKLEIISN